MANWREKIELNEVLSKMSDEYDLSLLEEDCPTPVKEAIAKEIEKSTWLKRFSSRIRKAKSIAAVNRILEQVFDEADRMKVWCGFSI